nr:hypothetical protein [Tanacetum cinerariifolium]
ARRVQPVEPRAEVVDGQVVANHGGAALHINTAQCHVVAAVVAHLVLADGGPGYAAVGSNALAPVETNQVVLHPVAGRAVAKAIDGQAHGAAARAGEVEAHAGGGGAG